MAGNVARVPALTLMIGGPPWTAGGSRSQCAGTLLVRVLQLVGD